MIRNLCARDNGNSLPIVEIACYIDTLQLRLYSPLPIHQLAQLTRFVAQGQCGDITHYRSKSPYQTWARTLRIQQPSRTVLHFLDRVLKRGSYHINRVDVALDYATRTHCDAEFVQQFFDRHLCQRYHGKREVTVYKDTRYVAPMSAPRNIVSYSSKPSKVMGGPCCHLEVRLKTPDRCRKEGFNTVRDVLRFDKDAFWAKHLWLLKLDAEKFERKTKKEAVAKFRPATKTSRKRYPDYDRSCLQGAVRRYRSGLVIWWQLQKSERGLVDDQVQFTTREATLRSPF